MPAGRGDLSRPFRRIAVRHHHAGRPGIERRQDVSHVGDPYDGGDVGGPGGEARDVDGRPIEWRMLLVDDDEIEPDLADDFHDMRGGKFDERTQHVLAI
jgi:hypothetical protein